MGLLPYVKHFPGVLKCLMLRYLCGFSAQSSDCEDVKGRNDWEDLSPGFV